MAKNATADSLCEHVIKGNLRQVNSILTAHPGLINTYDSKGRTPLYYACLEGHVDIVSILLTENSINLDLQMADDKRTALHIAVFHQRKKIIRLLIQRGARTDILNQEGKTALKDEQLQPKQPVSKSVDNLLSLFAPPEDDDRVVPPASKPVLIEPAKATSFSRDTPRHERPDTFIVGSADAERSKTPVLGWKRPIPTETYSSSLPDPKGLETLERTVLEKHKRKQTKQYDREVVVDKTERDGKTEPEKHKKKTEEERIALEKEAAEEIAAAQLSLAEAEKRAIEQQQEADKLALAAEKAQVAVERAIAEASLAAVAAKAAVISSKEAQYRLQEEKEKINQIILKYRGVLPESPNCSVPTSPRSTKSIKSSSQPTSPRVNKF